MLKDILKEALELLSWAVGEFEQLLSLMQPTYFQIISLGLEGS